MNPSPNKTSRRRHLGIPTTLLALCIQLLTGCGGSKVADPPVDMALFPDHIGNFERIIQPSYVLGEYSATYSHGQNYVTFKASPGTFQWEHSRDGELVASGDNFKISFVGGYELEFAAFDGQNSIIVTSSSADVMNDWANSFPYAQYKIAPPSKPIAIKFPPPEFTKGSSQGDVALANAGRETSLVLVNAWLDASGQTGLAKQAKLSKIDPSTMIVSNTDDSEDKKLTAALGSGLYASGIRQIFFSSKPTKLVPKPGAPAQKPSAGLANKKSA